MCSMMDTCNINGITLLENFCRTCMNADKEDNLQIEGKKTRTFSIFNGPESAEYKNTTIMELLLLITPQLRIDGGDVLPKTVCESCLERLINAYKFQSMCITAEQKLREMAKNIPLESQINEDPLKHTSLNNGANLQTVDALNLTGCILKMKVEEPLIDENETRSNKTMNDQTESIKIEVEDDRLENKTDCGDFDGDDSNSEWEIAFKDTNSEKGQKTKRLQNDDDTKEDDQTSEIIKESTNANIASKNYENKKVECDECGKRLSTNRGLKRHKRIHLRTIEVSEKNTTPVSAKAISHKNFECDECGKRLSTIWSVKQHKRLHQRPVVVGQRNTLVKMKHQCEFCKKIFKTSSHLKRHLPQHTGEHPYLCSECGKAFGCSANLKQHLLRHGTEKRYACPDCPKRFHCISNLITHKAVHNKIRPHVCDICGAGFRKPYLLKNHNLYHTGEKNHKCDYCDMRFFAAFHCQRHMRTHTGEKPHKCKYCERAFAQSNDLIKHLRVHLGDNVYKCDLCPQGFPLQRDLRAHFNNHKNDDEETKARNLQAHKDEEHRLQIKFSIMKST